MKKNFNIGKLLLIVVPFVVAAFVLYPTYQASQLENKENEAKKKAKEAKNSADSLSILQTFYNAYGADLQSAKNNRLKLGLDLRGGMYVTLEVDVARLIEESAEPDAADETFNQVIEATKEDSKTSEESSLDLFLKNFDRIARPQGKTLFNYFDIGNSKDISEEAIIDRLKLDAESAIEQAQEVIRQRIDKYGVSEPNIQAQGTRRILLELPGVTDETQMRSLLQTTARLEFKLVRNNGDIVRIFKKIDDALTSNEPTIVPVALAVESTTTTTNDTTNVANESSTMADTAAVKDEYAGLTDEQKRKKYLNEHKFTSKFASFFSPGRNQQSQPIDYTTPTLPDGNYIFKIHKDSIDRFLEILNRPKVKALIPAEYEIAISAKPNDSKAESQLNKIYDVYCLKKESELTGDVITDAGKNIDPTTNGWVVNMAMSTDGAEKWGRITGANIDKQIAIVLDERVYSAPFVNQKITGGNSQISGMANSEEAHLLEIVLKAGALKAPVKIIEERVVGASLGEDSIGAGINASLLAFVFVILYMAFYYNKAGMVADFAVMLNVLLIITILTALKGTLTLPGIAGIILTIGMAVDANVLIFERIREEIAKGRTLRSAIDEGFSKALTAILDSNITTFVTGLILFSFGSGLIQGFALTLMIGILMTLFTAITVTRALIELTMGNENSFSFGQSSNQ